MIQLQNPVSDHFETFIVGNALQWQVHALVSLEDTMPALEYASLKAAFLACKTGYAFADHAIHKTLDAFGSRHTVVREHEAKGQHLVLCGAGPSLKDHAKEWCPQADQVWGCNSAVTWLVGEGLPVTHGFTVDQTAHMCAEWSSMPDVEYLVASTVHPNLTEMLYQRERRLRFFHNFVGIRKPHVSWADENGVAMSMEYEDWLYSLLYPSTIRAGSGLNSVTRALDVATYMGFEKITVLGADCCLRMKKPQPKGMAFGSKKHIKWLRTSTVMHANGGHALASEATPVTLTGKIDGRTWLTKPDMAISAQWLARMARSSNGRITLIGDTLPNALVDKDEEFLRRMPNFAGPTGELVQIPVG